MKLYLSKILFFFFIVSIIFVSSCAKPLSAKETQAETDYYQEKYADEPEPSTKIQELLSYLDTCVDGKYIYGAQCNKITKEFVDNSNDVHPEYFSHTRFEYFSAIAAKCDQDGWRFPEDYAWDCSGLWWHACNILSLYDEYTDRTAHDTYHLYCMPITKDELMPGDLVFLENEEGRIKHMGIVGQKGYIYEAVSGFVGVVNKRTIDKRVYNDIVREGIISYKSWNVFGRPIIFE